MDTSMAHPAGTVGGGLNPPSAQQGSTAIWGAPLDGRYLWDVVEEQIYSEQRPTLEEQRPRYSYLKPPAEDDMAKEDSADMSIGE